MAVLGCEVDLSINRTILCHSPSRELGMRWRRKVPGYGCIRFKTPDDTWWKRIKLYTDAMVKRLSYGFRSGVVIHLIL